MKEAQYVWIGAQACADRAPVGVASSRNRHRAVLHEVYGAYRDNSRSAAPLGTVHADFLQPIRTEIAASARVQLCATLSPSV
jgi:hypothetical protein